MFLLHAKTAISKLYNNSQAKFLQFYYFIIIFIPLSLLKSILKLVYYENYRKTLTIHAVNLVIESLSIRDVVKVGLRSFNQTRFVKRNS